MANKYEGRVSIKRDTLGILGSSLGGLISCYAGWTRLDVFGKVGFIGSSFWWDDQDYQNNVVPQECPTKAGSMPQIYMDSGKGSRGERDCTQYTSEIYALEHSRCGFTAGANTRTNVQDGGVHNEASWASCFNILIQKFYLADNVSAAPYI